MTAMVRALQRRRRPFPIPESACRILDLAARDFVVSPTTYSLRRHAGQVEVMLVVSVGAHQRFSWNVTAMSGQQLGTFAEARRWVHSYAAGFGQTVTEAEPRRPRMKRPSRADAATMKEGVCKEAWLESDVPTLWAEAVVRCQHPAGYCGHDGYCHYGDCAMLMNDRSALA